MFFGGRNREFSEQKFTYKSERIIMKFERRFCSIL